MDTVLCSKNISAGYPRRDVLSDCTFEIKNSEFIGIIGPNGAGKSTLLRVLSRVLAPRLGSITYRGRDLYALTLQEAALSMAFVGQELQTQFPFSVYDLVLMGRTPFLKGVGTFSSRDRSIVEQSLQNTDTVHLKNRLIGSLSAGERQRVMVARALAQTPQILFLDEPTSHLDIGHQIEILDIIKQLNQSQGLTVITVLHDLNLASEYCDRLILLDAGRIFTAGTPQEVLTYQTIESIYKTLVVVSNNPISRKPHILLVPGKARNKP